jgi:hypothetical protein
MSENVTNARSATAPFGDGMDVSEWLRHLGLEQYAATFIENCVSMHLLPTQTADDLKDLGVS